MKMIPTSVFENLIKNLKSEKIGGEFEIAFTAQYNTYEINFYQFDDTEDDMGVCDYGYMENNQWVQCTPTQNQLATMKRIIAETLTTITENTEHNQKIEAEFVKDFYKYEEC